MSAHMVLHLVAMSWLLAAVIALWVARRGLFPELFRVGALLMSLNGLQWFLHDPAHEPLRNIPGWLWGGVVMATPLWLSGALIVFGVTRGRSA